MAIACVDTSSQAFKNKARELGISEGQLENILHEYINSPELQSQYTESQFISSKTDGLPNTQASDIMIEAWEKAYSTPQTFDTIGDFNLAKTQAVRIFGEQSIGHKETPDGKHTLTVAEPFNQEAYQKEIDSIKEKAIADGTFMKAPNGNQSNLNEQQWLQVRTKAFKRWFGDWENVAKQKFGRWGAYNKTRASYEGVEVSGQQFDPDMAPDGGTRIIWLGNEQIGEIPTIETSDKIQMSGSIGTATEVFEPLRGKGYGKKAHIALALIAANDGKTLYSDSSNSDAEDALWKSLVRDGLAEIIEERPKIGNWNHTTYRIINSALPQGEVHGYDENVSKVVDENGEPLVVYTGVPVKGISEFRFDTENRASLTSVLKKGIYFSDRGTASLYTKGKPFYKTTEEVNEQQAKKINALYWSGELSSENWVSEYVGLPYNIISKYVDDNINSVTGELDVVTIPKGEIIAALLNIKNPVYADNGGRTINHLSQDVIDNINSSEGAIIKNVDEHTRDNLTITNSTDYIVFSPNQIKSATENRGAFSTRDNNIYNEHEAISDRDSSQDARLNALREEFGVNPTMSQLLSLVGEDSEYSGIISLLKTKKDGRIPLLSNVKVHVWDSDYTGNFRSRRAYYDADTNTININSNAVYKGGRADSVIMHEVMHAIAVNRIIGNTRFRNEFDKIIAKYLQYFPEERGKYGKESFGKSNPHYMEEFIADVWSNQNTIDNLKSIKSIGKTTLWDRIKQFFVKIFAGSKGTLMADASDAIYRLLDSPEIIRSRDSYYENESPSNIEVSTAGDEFGKQFSAFNARFKEGTIVDGVDVSGRSIEDVYQTVIKKSGKNQPPAQDSRLYNPSLKTKEEREEFSYQEAYLPLWQEWARQNPDLIEQLRERAEGKTLTDKFAHGAVSQARALTEILSQGTQSSSEKSSQVLQPIREANRPFFNRQALLRRKTDALYDNEIGLTTTEVDEEAGLLANWISDQITEVQLHPENYYELFGKPKTNEWATEEDKKKDIDAIKSMSRRDITSNIGIQNLINLYKEQIFEENEALDDLSGRDFDKAMLLSDNLDVLFELGRAVFSDNEGYSIKHNDELNTYETTDMENQTAEDNPDDGAVVGEEQGNLEDWMVDKTTVEVLGNASALIRSALGKLYKRDENGEIVTDYLGRRLRVAQNDAVKSIIRWIQGSRNVDDMVRKLETKAKENTWIQPIIDRLNDRSGNETDFISQFNTVFDKHFRLFDVIKKSKGTKKNYALEVNSHPAVNDAYNYVSTMYTIGEAPLFTSRGINKRNLAQWETITERLKANSKITEEQFEQYKDGYVTRFLGLATLLGYPISKETIQKSLTYNNLMDAITAANKILTNLKTEADNPEFQPYTYKEGGNYISGYVKDLLTVLVDSVEDVTENSFYENGKMRQSYQIPSYASKLFQKLTSDKDSFNKTLEDEFGKYEWFREKDGTWRMPLLQELSKMDEETRKKVLVHKVNLNFQGDQYMRGLSPEKYALSVLTEFAGGETLANGFQTAFYGFPMQSNKASSDFYSFRRYVGDTAKSIIKNKMMSVFRQELSRIQTVRKRNRKEGDADYIEGFDKRGRNFCLLDFLNDPSKLVREHTDENGKTVTDSLISAAQATELHNLIEAKVSGEKIQESRLFRLAEQAIEENFNQRVEQFKNQCISLGLMDSIRNIEGVLAKSSKIPPQKQVENFIENFVWNDALAKINIIELLVTDPAYYKNDDDFQKRFAQVHSPGIRGYADATDYNGNKVSDGYLRAVVLKDGIIDGKTLKNNIIENLSIILDRDIEKASADTREGAIALKENILGRMEGINVTDGQALSALTATRKKGFIFGTWSRDAERVYERLRNGEYNLEDLETAFNVKKPFVYTQLSQDVHSEDTPLQTLKVPTQFKDSEYLLIMAAAMLESAETGRPNLLKVFYDFMEETAYDVTDDGETYNGKGIDIMVFESGVKSGLTGVSNITELWANASDGLEGLTLEQRAKIKDAKEYTERTLLNKLRSSVYTTDAEGNRIYNDVMVKSIPVEDYAIQNEVPLHMRDHTQIWGSQMRAILESNLAYVDYQGNPVRFNWTDAQGNEHSDSREEFVQNYEKAAKAVADEAVKSIRDDLGLGNGNLVDQRVAIAKELQREIMANPGRYGNDLLLACTVDEYGNFRIPPGDPIQSKRIEQLVNSIVKNRLNKPKVPGGLGVQVSNFGTSRRLNMRFFMKDGKTLLPTRDEWLSENPNKTVEDYKEYCRENQGGYAYEENYAPAHTRAFFDLFTGRDGNIDLEAIEMLDENLLYSIDQRTPTEFYYSIAIAKIVGFLPKEAGDGFMRPYEITEKDDSDFDVDKETKWKKSFSIKRVKERVTNKQLKDAVPELENTQLTNDERQEVIDAVENRLSWSGLSEERYEKERERQITRELEKVRQRKIYGLIKDFRSSDIFSPSEEKPSIWKDLKKAYIKLQYSVDYPTEGANAALNNAWEMSKAVLQHESNASKILSPGGPDAITRRGYLIGALKTGRYTEEQLNAMSTKELGDIAKSNNMNLVWFTNQMEYYKRNNDASSNLGIFAVANTAHSILEGQGYGVTNDEEFTILGKKFGTEVYLDDTYDDIGVLISKTLGGNVGAAADAAKTPSHAFMNVNGNTINEFIFLIRAGMNLDDATFFIATKPIEDLIQKYNALNVAGYKSLDSLLQEEIDRIVQENSIKSDSSIYQEKLNHDEVIKAIIGRATPEITLKTLLMFQRIKNLTPGMRALTFATRYNSVASAVGPQIVDNLIHEHQVNNYADSDKVSTIQKTYKYEDASNGNAEVKFGDTVKDIDGRELVLSPDNLEILRSQGVINVVEDFKTVTIQDIMRAHPMLAGFSQGYGLVSEIFDILNMPANSTEFKSVLDSNPVVSEFLYRDKKTLSAFSDFYQSYLLIQSGAVSTKASKYGGPAYFVRQFPKDFLKQRAKYAGNALIDAIRPEVRDNIVSLKINTTGLKEQDKAKFKAAWNQLYKQNATLATMLFEYNFWKGGIGFSPKTFMNLLPIQMKENIKGYINTYKDMPLVNAQLVTDQFFLNNVGNNKVVRRVDKIDGVRFENGVYSFTDIQYNDFKDLPFFKWQDEAGDYHVFKQTSQNKKKNIVNFVEVDALGNGGEFIEMSTNVINNPLFKTRQFEEDEFNTDTESVPIQPEQPVQRTPEQIEVEIEEVLSYLKGYDGNYLSGVDVEGTRNLLRNVKTGQVAANERNMNIWKNSLKERFRENGIEFSDEQVDNIVKKFC